jgi:hypothetical protein
LDAIDEFKFDALLEVLVDEEAKAKKHFSVQDDFGQWDEKTNVQLFDIFEW